MARARGGERGVVVVFVAIALIVIFGFMVLSMNIGHQREVRGQLQNAVDAAALAAARELDGTTTPLTNGVPQDWAVRAAAWHPTDNDQPGVVVDRNLDFEFGWWDPFGSAFYPLNSPGFNTRFGTEPIAQARNVNAVHVTAVRNEGRGNAITAWGGALLNKPTVSTYADAIAINGGPCGTCPTVPLAFFDCGLYFDQTLQCWRTASYHFRAEMAPDPTDSIGYSSLSPEAANTDIYQRILACNGDCSSADCQQFQTTATDPINVSNGNQLNPLCPGFDQHCHADPTTGNCTAADTIEAPVVDGQCSFPDNPPRFNQAHAVIGTAKFRMTKLVCHGNEKYMEFEFLCNQTDSNTTRYGCGFWGTGPTEPRLVR
jgi:hypothetical protein